MRIMKEFDMHSSDEYAGFYQNVIKRDLLSSKLFIVLCACTLTASLASISFLSHLNNRSYSTRNFISELAVPRLVPISHSSYPNPLLQTTVKTEKSINLPPKPILSPLIQTSFRNQDSFVSRENNPILPLQSWMNPAAGAVNFGVERVIQLMVINEHHRFARLMLKSAVLEKQRPYTQTPEASASTRLHHIAPVSAVPTTVRAPNHKAGKIELKVQKNAPAAVLNLTTSKQNAATINTSSIVSSTSENKLIADHKFTVINLTIKKNLLIDAKKAGLSKHFAYELTQAFSGKLNIKKVRSGDRFTVLYQKHTQKKQNDIEILAIKYTNSRNKQIKIVRLTEGAQKGNFLSLDHLTKKNDLPAKNKAAETLALAAASTSTTSILRKPVKSGRVSSPFHPHRYHPILKRYRAHLGVDYAATAGSPIIASGDGKITFVGYQHGYGNLVTIQHDNKYTTRYGHMARFAKIKVGTKVKQGQVIGFVGKTGYATGHHVHYEIRINGKPYNPLTVALPNIKNKRKLFNPPIHSHPIPTKNHHEIVSKAKLLFAKMDELNKSSKQG